MNAIVKHPILIGFIILLGVGMLFVLLFNMSSESGDDVTAMLQPEVQAISQQAESDSMSHIRFEDLHDLTAIVDRIVLGTVIEVHDNISGDEYVFKIEKQYKGNTDSETIYVYEPKETLQLEQKYLLFLYVTDNGYYPELIHTSQKDAIITVYDDFLAYRTPLLDQDISLRELESILESSPGIEMIATEDITRGHPYVEKSNISLEEIAAQADFIAHVVPHSVTLGNKYARHTQFDFKEIFRDESGYEVNANTGFTMPGAMDIGEDYIIFLNFHDNFGFLVVSVNGSMIMKSDAEAWDRALTIISQFDN